jgi:valyl-tRNA synthetase
MLNETIQDILVRKLAGRQECLLGAWHGPRLHCHGSQVVNRLAQQASRRSTDLTREEFLKHAWDGRKSMAESPEAVAELGRHVRLGPHGFTMDETRSRARHQGLRRSSTARASSIVACAW